MTTFLQAGIICCAALLLTAIPAVPAEARIQCRGNFQMTKYGPIATPARKNRLPSWRGVTARASRAPRCARTH